ncbi:interactor protein for cytohesin exchange factors 1 isoform X2 [Notamacropus eugenii]|uniref:interactor protein for cytohesin exchange factors 1 isoform X2 n=1 Tax=Notamacropus eugenii TaxID=9315 RepID=UPI003B67D325
MTTCCSLGLIPCGFFTMSRRRISCKDLGHADFQGWLYKKKEKGTFLSNKWRKFWVVLKGASLYWYSNQMAEKADGFINLPDFAVDRAAECKKKHAFKISHPQIKTFYFAAENVQEMNMWLNKLGLAVIRLASTGKEEECYSESEHEDPEITVETPPPPYSAEPPSHLGPQEASSSSLVLNEPSSSLSSLESSIKSPSSSSSTSKAAAYPERQSWLDIVNSSSATEDVGQSIMVQIHSPALPEASENGLVKSESGFLNSLSSEETSSLNSSLDHLSVPDDTLGLKTSDRGVLVQYSSVKCSMGFLPGSSCSKISKEQTKGHEDDEMEKLYKSLEQASLSPIGDRRPSTKKELRKSFVKRSKNPSINEKLHKIRTLNSTLKCKEHDLAMINQLLEDPKLTAKKYREWKNTNSLLVQEIYQQQCDKTMAEGPYLESEGQPSLTDV